MTSRRSFAPGLLEAIREAQVVGIRAGSEAHRIIGIWAVVVEGRVFVRSYFLAPRSWYRTFLDEPRGLLTVGRRKVAVRAVRTRSERLWDAVDAAYAEKYPTPGSRRWVRGFRSPRRRATTTELVPL